MQMPYVYCLEAQSFCAKLFDSLEKDILAGYETLLGSSTPLVSVKTGFVNSIVISTRKS